MIRLSTTAAASAAVSGARSVDVLAYTLRRGPLLDALEAAALHGACVHVRLEGAPFGDPGGQLATHNRRIAGELARCGADAQLARSTPGSRGDLPVHAKALVADGRLFLDDRNWGANDFVVADSDRNAVREVSAAVEIGAARDATDASFAFSKRGALQREADLLRAARTGADVVVESESFGFANPVYVALDQLARRGSKPRLIVSSREARNAREGAALARLARDGADVRLTSATEKFALAGTRAWIGSANASPDCPKLDMIDWGLCTSDAATVAAARARVEARWSAARPFANG
jgi:hypothetical protein